MDQTIALAVLLLWIIIPALHVGISPAAGSWAPPAGSKCPFGPRVGWLMIVLVLGLIGWVLFLRSRNKARE